MRLGSLWTYSSVTHNRPASFPSQYPSPPISTSTSSIHLRTGGISAKFAGVDPVNCACSSIVICGGGAVIGVNMVDNAGR